ncbi:unnamed protein product [Cyprideis torosa]|uniref:Uncharacterized protein n=1 Tax=Cyprideis torosa TaxID=163714 RepID=A0A7R8WB70_9CRUS|nr:unnamed protein product [Cyprideis torosa]CAG0891979.1 unnamed protein product [Cyprideis torosa]
MAVESKPVPSVAEENNVPPNPAQSLPRPPQALVKRIVAMNHTSGRDYAGQDRQGPSLVIRDIINFGSGLICLGIAGYIFFFECKDPFRHMVGGAVFGVILLFGAFRTWTCPCPYDTNDDQILIAGAGVMLGYFLVHYLRCCKAKTYSLIFVVIGAFQVLRTILKTFGIIPCNW